MKKIAHVNPIRNHQMTVYYDEKAERNPYRVYLEGTHTHPEYGYPVPFRRQINRFEDLLSAMYLLTDYIRNNNEDHR